MIEYGRAPAAERVRAEAAEVAHPHQFAGRQEAIQDLVLVQHLQGVGVHPAGPQLARPLHELLDHHVDVRRPQLAGVQQACRPGGRSISDRSLHGMGEWTSTKGKISRKRSTVPWQ